jgi:tetratricopeptide (TPR) repeat protein
LAIEEAAKRHPAAEPLIMHAALLAPEPIPLFLFDEGREELGDPLESLLSDHGIDEAVATLRAFALVECESIPDERVSEITTDTIRLHRLVREVAFSRIEAKDRNKYVANLIVALATVYPPDVGQDPNCWPRARRLDPLIEMLVGGDFTPPESTKAAAVSLLNRVARYRRVAIGAYVQARLLLEKALIIAETAFGPNHPITGVTANSLAVLLLYQEDFDAARPLCERVLAIAEERFGAENPDTATALNNLASVLQQQGDLVGARVRFERSLAIYEKSFGENPHTADCLANLGTVMTALKDFGRAKELFERALSIRESVLGPEHPDTANSLNNLGGLFLEQGDLSAARHCFERALVICEGVFGPDHPHTGLVRRNISRLLPSTNDLGDMD